MINNSDLNNLYFHTKSMNVYSVSCTDGIDCDTNEKTEPRVHYSRGNKSFSRKVSLFHERFEKIDHVDIIHTTYDKDQNVDSIIIRHQLPDGRVGVVLFYRGLFSRKILIPFQYETIDISTYINDDKDEEMCFLAYDSDDLIYGYSLYGDRVIL